MQISLKYLILPTLTIAVFAGFGGGKFFAHNRMQEIGIVLNAILFIEALYLSAFRLRSGQLLFWTGSWIALIVFIILFWSGIFSIKAGVSFGPSLLASREFLLLLITPVIYLLYRSGLRLDQIQVAVIAGLTLATVSYLFFYHTLNLKDAYFSEDPFTHHLVTYDESRGFRLKPPTYAVMLLALISIFTLFSQSKLRIKFLALIGIALSIYIWTLVQIRTVTAGVLFALILYPILWHRRRNIYLVIALIPIVPAIAFLLVDPFIYYIQQAHGGEIRLAAYELAITEIKSNWLVGWGQSSGYTKTYQDLFGPKFFPSDLGIVGIMFKYGGIGTAIYLIACPLILYKVAKAQWLVRELKNEPDPLFQALTVFITTLCINIILWPGFAYAQGLTAAGITIGLSACVSHKYQNLSE